MEEEIKRNLINLSDPRYKEFHGSLCPNINNIIGVRVPVLRKYAKELLKEYDLEFLLRNIGEDYYEEIMLQGMVIGLSKEENLSKVIKNIEQFVPKIDNWAICDTFCAGLKITNKNKEEMWKFINKYSDSEKEFELRFYIVMMIDYYIEEQYIDKCLEAFNSIKSEKYYVQMALAWAISVCLIKFFEKTIEYLNNCELDEFTYQKAIQKAIESYRINNEKKEILKKLKKNRKYI